ncbi:MAG: enoyl-CoA hydratase/isomerase family protein [Sphingobacteriales bacterium]|nr:MAG: enoyl-CoA hydratase/isomerase family protein [Sphingobacteriales bacterium]
MSVDTKEAHVKTELHNGVATIEFFHPQSNSLPARILEQLAHAIHSAGNDPEVKVILLRSAGEKAFCAGASFDELAAIKTEEEGLQFFSGFAQVINEMRTCPKLIVGRVHGKCVGGGVGIVAALDYAIATEAAEIKLSELSIGIGPFVVGPAVERKIGLSAFTQLAIDATMWRNGDWARRKGLYAELHPTEEGMDESISRLIFTLAHSSQEAMAEIKKISWKGTEHWDQLLAERAAISGRLVLSEFSKNAIANRRKK